MRTNKVTRWDKRKIAAAVTTAIALAITFTFTACGGKGDGKAANTSATTTADNGGKLLKEIVDGYDDDGMEVGLESGNYYNAMSFKYDAQNRIVSILEGNGDGYGTEKILVYKDNDLATVKTVTYSEMRTDTTAVPKIVRNGNTISIGDDSIIVNSDGDIIRLGNQSYQVSYQYRDGNLIKGTTLNDGKEEVTEYKYGNKKSLFYNSNTPKWILQYFSNPIYASKNNPVSGNSTVYKYEYDSDGFPTKRTSDGTTTIFTYISK